MTKHLHIISFDVPYPADYGGVFDVFYKLPHLKNAGISIHLHCFMYGRAKQKELEKYCASVHYYQRKKRFSLSLPYIVSSRKNKELLSRLLKDDYPILMEGIHCTYPLLDVRFHGRKMFIRLHNTEFVYYHHLYKTTRHVFKKIYYGTESFLLRKYEKRIAGKASHIWAMSQTDVEFYERCFTVKTISYLPLFLPPFWKVNSKEGIGTYCLYHGNLSVEENETAVIWLLDHVFVHLSVPVIIAGKQPSQSLMKKIKRYRNVTIIANPSEEKMNELIADAQIHVLPSLNATGIKIKLLNALFNGRHCIVNGAAVAGTSLEQFCVVADDANDMMRQINNLINILFSGSDIQRRKELLQDEFNGVQRASVIYNSI